MLLPLLPIPCFVILSFPTPTQFPANPISPFPPSLYTMGYFSLLAVAQDHQALIVAVQHRYYGSYPTPDFSTANLRFLSSRQALADLAAIHDHLVSEYSLTSQNRFISFGGSYPGMLAAWVRLEYPELIYAAVSSSSPVLAQDNFQGYNDVCAASLAAPIVGGSPACLQAVSMAFAAVGAGLASADGRRDLEKQFNLCDTAPLDTAENQAEFTEALMGAFPVQENDPSCSSPACNIEKQCSVMLDESMGTPLDRLGALAHMAFGADCINVSHANTVQGLTNTTIEGGGSRIWFYQV